MPAFAYKARMLTGGLTEGVLEAPDQRSAMDQLRGQKLTPVEVVESAPSLMERIRAVLPIKPTVKAKELVLFSRQLSTLVSAGVPLVQGLTILEEQVETKLFRGIVHSIKEDIEAGQSITDALRKHPDAFEELYVSMIKAGEVGGILDVILERLSSYLENAEALRAKVKGALMYPLVVSIIASCVTLFLLMFVIPTFAKIFASFGAELPFMTQILINTSNILRHFWYIVIAVPVGASIALKQYSKTEGGRRNIDSLMLNLPIFGILLKKVAVAKFTRTLGTLIKSGVPILQALETVAKTSGNKVIEIAIMTTRESVKEGERIAIQLRKANIFPPMVVQMVAIGEETGNLDTMLSKIADFYDQEVDVAVKGLTSMIEPIIIVVMGLVIGFIVIAMFLPMFELGELASRQG
ncbi:MAG: type II secretion system F family protein [Elusimicrobia bacterium]|nr:type II secretion system F family protein [Elusimicrobiota bacterium]